MSYEIQPVYIAGPTASGKSELAIRLARKLDGIVISADSMQIYKGLDIGTAKVSKQIRDEIPHKLIDIVNFDEEYSVAQFAEDAKTEINSAIECGKLPIIVGGTGLYFESLFYPMSFGHTVKDEKLRESLKRDYEMYGGAALHDRLRALDAETANRLHENDAKRIIRALEIILTTGKTLSQNGDERQKVDAIAVAFNDERQKLYDRINERVDQMFKDGLPQEALSLKSFDCQSMQAIGYKEFANCKYDIVDGNYVLDSQEETSIKEEIKKHTRNYAKRQITWFKRYSFIKWFNCGDYDGAMQYIINRLNTKNS